MTEYPEHGIELTQEALWNGFTRIVSVGGDGTHYEVLNGFFDGAKFFRVLPGFVVQFGLPADPEAAASIPTASIKDDPVKASNTKGTITFATAGPNTRTTQVFINLGDNPRLDGMGFAPFGKVTEGMDIVEQLFAGYGEGAPHGNGPEQGRVRVHGNKYLDANFPKLDGIKKASVAE